MEWGKVGVGSGKGLRGGVGKGGGSVGGGSKRDCNSCHV